MTTDNLKRANEIQNELSRLNHALFQIEKTEIFNGCSRSFTPNDVGQTESFLIHLEVSNKLGLVNQVNDRIFNLTNELKFL